MEVRVSGRVDDIRSCQRRMLESCCTKDQEGRRYGRGTKLTDVLIKGGEQECWVRLIAGNCWSSRRTECGENNDRKWPYKAQTSEQSRRPWLNVLLLIITLLFLIKHEFGSDKCLQYGWKYPIEAKHKCIHWSTHTWASVFTSSVCVLIWR